LYSLLDHHYINLSLIYRGLCNRLLYEQYAYPLVLWEKIKDACLDHSDTSCVERVGDAFGVTDIGGWEVMGNTIRNLGLFVITGGKEGSLQVKAEADKAKEEAEKLWEKLVAESSVFP
jgi:hypothetical protein